MRRLRRQTHRFLREHLAVVAEDKADTGALEAPDLHRLAAAAPAGEGEDGARGAGWADLVMLLDGALSRTAT